MIWDISTDIRGGVNQTVSESVGFSRYPDLGVGTNYLFTLTQVGGAGRTVQYSLTNADNLDPSADKRLLYKVDGLLWNNTYTMSLQVSNPVNITTPLIAATVVITPGYTPTPNGWTGLPFSVNRVQGVWIPVLTPGVQPVQVVDLPINFQTPVVAQATVVSAIATSVIPTDVDSWHKRQHMCETVKFGHWNSALTANSTSIYGIYNPSSTVYLHTRFDIACANGTAQVWANKIGFGAAGTTLTARILEPCSAFANVPKVYYAPTPVGTPTDGNQVAEMLFTGVADTTGPTGSKSGMVVGTDGDWFAVAPLSSYVIRIIAGATDIKYELHMGFYQDLD